MTPEFRQKLIEAACEELNWQPSQLAGARLFVEGLLLGYQLGSPGAFGGMAQMDVNEDGGVKTLVREAVELSRMATTR
jgi:hypothetical protein